MLVAQIGRNNASLHSQTQPNTTKVNKHSDALYRVDAHAVVYVYGTSFSCKVEKQVKVGECVCSKADTYNTGMTDFRSFHLNVRAKKKIEEQLVNKCRQRATTTTTTTVKITQTPKLDESQHGIIKIKVKTCCSGVQCRNLIIYVL